MITAHLTEAEIQLYVTEPEAISRQQAVHLENCPACQSRAFNYALLIKGIQDTPAPKFDFDLSALVLEQLPAARNSFPWAAILIPALSVLLVAVSALFFWSAIVKVIQDLSGIMFAAAAAGALVIVIFQVIEMLKDNQKSMDTLLNQKTLQL